MLPALSDLPALNACLNSASAVFLAGGYIAIRRRNVPVHRIFMGAAFLTSTLFLSSYLYYHFHAGSTRFTGTGWVRAVYFTILLTHTVLATAIVPMVLLALVRALSRQERRMAAWALRRRSLGGVRG